ncbi:hypothetical protein LCR01_05060 [Companilactobacillus crustorum]|uniref:Uncharacterized protein n=4 Tax=Companilactobacillus TaxID=2767879 RepID=A0A837RIM2_9LACO|nr:hypothetical protein [Companilactobacillus crustorum]HCD08592.1 hypothetical protein [Lactobacillus sp.]APU71824.1 hypothetical protein BI355_1519 [Companilactobacillus crustorum]KRK43637.1 hypothetical protein FD26_GL001846 [Companilactobacillus crustorum JCM 15951]WDT64840.1 hypothetical protein NV391_07635 [Companilactobacillus crustorum]GEO76063.1 hypothetical protein LCR01_05060 [Companilactobacillus crustorum]
MMMYPYLKLGPRDGVMLISVFIMLVLTLVFKWSVWEFAFSVGAVIIAFLAGSMKPNKKNVLAFLKK